MTFEDEETLSSKPFRFLPSVRFSVALLGFGSTTFLTAHLSTLNFAWVCMVNESDILSNDSSLEYEGSFSWTKIDQQNIFVAFSVGALAMALLAGWFIDRFGSKIVLGSAIILSSTMTTCVPIFAHRFGPWSVAILRGLVGAAWSVSWPTVYDICSHWSASSDLGIFFPLILSGFQLGCFFCLALAGLQCKYLGWEWIFYSWGLAALLYSIVFLYSYANDPLDSAQISETERLFILSNRERVQEQRRQTPWKDLLTSLAVWSCMISNFVDMFTAILVCQYTPTYLKEALHMPVESNAILSAAPFITFLLGRWLAGLLSNQSCGCPRNFSIKAFTTAAFIGCGVCTISLTLVKSGHVILICAMMFCGSLHTGGHLKSPLFIAPQFGGVVGGLDIICAFAANIIQPFLVSKLTPNGTIKEWNQVFYVVAALNAGGALFFATFGKGEREPWAMEPAENLHTKPSSMALLPEDEETVEKLDEIINCEKTELE